MTRITLLFLTMIALSSCAGFKAPDYSKISIGMSPAQVVERLGKNYTVISAKKYDDGVLEIYQYPIYSRFSGEQTTSFNWLLFFNNQLEEWGPKEQYEPQTPEWYYRRLKH